MNLRSEPRIKTNLDVLYWEVEDMMHKLAWRASAKYGLTFAECMSECNWAFMRAVYWRFDPDKGVKFSTKLYDLIQWRFRTMFRLAIKEQAQMPTVELDEELAGSVPAERSEFVEGLLKDLSGDAREILDLLVNTPRELAEDGPHPKELWSRVKRYLLNRRGWKKRNLRNAQKEIKLSFRFAYAS